MFITRTISLTNFLVATSALGFQVCVLYPWHKQLDDDFEALKKEHLRVLDTIKNTADGAVTDKPKGIRHMLSGLSAWGWPGKKDVSSLALRTDTTYNIVGHSPASSPSPLGLVAAAQMPQHMLKPLIAKSLNKLDDVALYSRYALAGAVCCSFTHAILTPVDM
jgi:solute carrier family 25 (mitochondrial phosphate transporter), member 3